MRDSLVIALVVASLVSTASSAHAQSAPPSERGVRPQQRGVQGRQDVKKERGPRAVRGRRGMLKGIELGDAERAKLVAIRAKYRAEGESLRATLRPVRSELRAARLKGDTAALRTLRARGTTGREQVRALHERQVAEIRGALSAENQRLFDARVAERTKRRAEGRDDRRVGGRRGMKGGHRRPGLPRPRRAGTNG